MSHASHASVFVAVLLVVLGASGPARPQQRDPAAAEALFQRGRAALDGGDLATACASFAESHRLDPAPGTLLNLARCEEMRGRLAEAWEHYRAATDQLAASDDRLPPARERAEALEKRLPKLLLRLPAGAPAGARVLRDQIELRGASLGVALPVNPGPHTIEVLAPGRASASQTITLREGEQRELTLTLGSPLPAPGALSAAASAPSPPPLPPPRTRATVGWAVGSVGAAAVVASLGMGLWAFERKREVNTRCPGGQCDEEGLKAGGELKTLTRLSTGAFVVGLVGVGAGAYLLLTGDSRSAWALSGGQAPMLIHRRSFLAGRRASRAALADRWARPPTRASAPAGLVPPGYLR